MSKKTLLVGFALVLAAGCGINVDESDEEVLRRLMVSSGYSQGTGVKGSADTSSKALLPADTVTPLGWIREQTYKNNPDVSISIVGDSAFVSLEGTQGGNFHLVAYDPDSAKVVDFVKSYEDGYYIAAIFKRIGDDQVDNGWVMTDVSNINMESSQREPRIKLDSLLLEGGNPDSIMITDSKALYDAQDPRWCSAGDSIRITAFTSDTNAVMAAYGFTQDTGKGVFLSQSSPGVWTGAVQVIGSGMFYVAVDVLPWEVVNTVSEPYAAQLWIAQFQMR